MRCKNAFDAKMHFCNASNAFLQRIKCIFATHQMHFCNASNAFLQRKTKCDAKMHFCTASLFFAKQKTQHFCTAEHFPLENVMLNILLRKM